MRANDADEPQHQAADQELAALFAESAMPVELRLASFGAFVRPRYLARFLGLYELFKLIVDVKGSIVDCGVFQGASLMTWAKLARILDPANARRAVYGFDTFAGFPEVSAHDGSAPYATPGTFAASGGLAEVTRIVDAFHRAEQPAPAPMITLVPGDAVATIPAFVQANPSLVVSLLFLDFDLHEPTGVALRHFVPRMPRGAVIAFDELDDPQWPGETEAVMAEFGLRNLALRRVPLDAAVSYARLD